MLIRDAYHPFVEALSRDEDLATNTLRAYLADARSLAGFLGEDRTISSVTPTDVESFAAQLASSGLARASARRRIAGARRFCRWLADQGLLAQDPSSGCRIKPARCRPLPRALNRTDAARLLQDLRTRCDEAHETSPNALLSEMTTYVAASLMLATGVRACELVALEVADVDLDGGALRVLGKGRRERVVFVPDRGVLEITGVYLTERKAGPADPLVCNRGGGALSTSALRGRIAGAAVRAGIERRITPHMLRHTCATQLLDAGIDIRLVQRLIGNPGDHGVDRGVYCFDLFKMGVHHLSCRYLTILYPLRQFLCR